MNQSQPSPQQNNLNIVYWAIAAEPLILAAIAMFLKTQGAVGDLKASGTEELLLTIFIFVSLISIWFSFRFASGKSILPSKLPPDNNPNPVGFRICAMALTTTPAILGFVHYIHFGNDLSLLIFNGGATCLAIWHITQFKEGNS